MGDVDVRENLRHTRMLRHFLGWVGWGMLTFLRTCDTHAQHQNLAMASDELQRKYFGENWSHVGQAHVQLKGKKIRASFQHKNPCNLQTMMLKPLDFPRENSRIFEMKVNSFAMAKTTLFSKPLKTLARFSPRRDVFDCFYWKQRKQEGVSAR